MFDITITNFQNWIKADKNRAGNLSWDKIFHEFVEQSYLPSLMSLEFFDAFTKLNWKNEWGNIVDYRKVVVNWENETWQKERERQKEIAKKDPKNVEKELRKWLIENPNHTNNLPAWDKIINFFINPDEEILQNLQQNIIELFFKFIREWRKEDGQLMKYFELLERWEGDSEINIKGIKSILLTTTEMCNEMEKLKQELTQFKTQQTNLERELSQKNQTISQLNQKIKDLEKVNNEVIKMTDEIYQELINNKPDLEKIKKKVFEIKIKIGRDELEKLKTTLESKLEQNSANDLDDLLEAQEEFTKSNNPYAQKQLGKFKKRLLANEKVNMEEIEKICELQKEIVNLEMKVEEKLEAAIEEIKKL